MGDLEQKAKILEKYRKGRGFLRFNGERVFYTITAKDMPQQEHGIDFEMHAGYWGKDLLFVSEAIPYQFRDLVLWHELREYTELGGSTQRGSCLQASRDEFQEIPEKIRREYIRFRHDQLAQLVHLFGDGDSIFTSNLRASLDFWARQD